MVVEDSEIVHCNRMQMVNWSKTEESSWRKRGVEERETRNNEKELIISFEGSNVQGCSRVVQVVKKSLENHVSIQLDLASVLQVALGPSVGVDLTFYSGPCEHFLAPLVTRLLPEA